MWSGLSSLLFLSSLMLLLQLGFRLPWQALVGHHPTMACPPPLPNPLCISLSLLFSYFTLIFGATWPGLCIHSLLLGAPFVLGFHLLMLLWRCWLPLSSPVRTISDSRFSCKIADCFRHVFMWWSDCCLFLVLGCCGWFHDPTSFPLIGQYSFLMISWWILACILCSAFWSIGSMNAVSNSSHHPKLVIMTNSWGRSYLHIHAPWSCFETTSPALTIDIFCNLLFCFIFLLTRVGQCSFFVAFWSLIYNLSGPCIALGVFWYSWFLLVGWGVLTLAVWSKE